jgi:hypothetical protein
VTGWNNFEPWLSRIEAIGPEQLWAIAEAVPPEWYGGDLATIERLMEDLLTRRGRVKDLLAGFRDSTREPFPNWNSRIAITVPRSFVESTVGAKFVM